MPKSEPHVHPYRMLGRMLKQARERAGYTQEGIARAIGLSRTSYTNVEAGRQRLLPHHLFLVTDILEIPPKAVADIFRNATTAAEWRVLAASDGLDAATQRRIRNALREDGRDG